MVMSSERYTPLSASALADACAAALGAIEEMETHDLPGRARQIERIFRTRLSELADDHPSIGEIRGRGAMMAVELVETSRLFARLCAPIDPQWVIDLAGDRLKRSYRQPRWEQHRGQWHFSGGGWGRDGAPMHQGRRPGNAHRH